MMAESFVNIMFSLAGIYLLIGLIFAFIFAFSLVNRFDEQAKDAPLMFRLLIIPASALLWVYLIVKLRKKGRA